MKFDGVRLARAIAYWLEYKRLSNFQPLFGEAIVTYAIAEYLIGAGYKISAEQDLRKVDSRLSDVGYAAIDLVAESLSTDVNKVAFEIKYLKSRQGFSRVSDDILKLSYINFTDWSRYFVVAYPASLSLYDQLPGPDETVEWKFGRVNDDQVQVIVPSKRLAGRIDAEFAGRMPSGCLLKHAKVSIEDMAVSIFDVNPQ